MSCTVQVLPPPQTLQRAVFGSSTTIWQNKIPKFTKVVLLSLVTQYTTDLIQRAKIIFRPGTVLANALASLSYSKVRVKYTKEEASGEGEEDTSGEEA